MDDLENCSHRSNLHLVGLPERKARSSFLEKWLPDVLGTVKFLGPLLIERVHRIGNEAEVWSVVRPRVVIMKSLNYTGHEGCQNEGTHTPG